MVARSIPDDALMQLVGELVDVTYSDGCCADDGGRTYRMRIESFDPVTSLCHLDSDGLSTVWGEPFSDDVDLSAWLRDGSINFVSENDFVSQLVAGDDFSEQDQEQGQENAELSVNAGSSVIAEDAPPVPEFSEAMRMRMIQWSCRDLQCAGKCTRPGRRRARTFLGGQVPKIPQGD
eukprot:TRINITY_DN103102_c0_g1_i1.p1 TRINITY_DN103102_c0_g1~~TRINITY_DN103102_c0_g1_i1.p1  ORF type:complete len:193 (-),score=27.45 TRINITY_DN103102_c0_g1_i1:85-615(-)